MVTPAISAHRGLDGVVVARAPLLQPAAGRLLRRGVRAAPGCARGVYYLLLLNLTALTVVLLVTVVGIVLVIALLTLPWPWQAFSPGGCGR